MGTEPPARGLTAGPGRLQGAAGLGRTGRQQSKASTHLDCLQSSTPPLRYNLHHKYLDLPNIREEGETLFRSDSATENRQMQTKRSAGTNPTTSVSVLPLALKHRSIQNCFHQTPTAPEPLVYNPSRLDSGISRTSQQVFVITCGAQQALSVVPISTFLNYLRHRSLLSLALPLDIACTCTDAGPGALLQDLKLKSIRPTKNWLNIPVPQL